MPEEKETWIQMVALTATVLAVLAAIASLRASSYSTKVQIAATKEANQWAYFQSKSIKEHSYALNRDILASVRLQEIKNPKAQKYLNNKIKEYEDEISRYGKEKDQIKQGAEELVKEQEGYKLKNANFSLAVMLLQIAIMCSAVGALIKKKILWLMGLILGGWGVYYFVMGFLR
ncbi:MAG: DUF4337 domain-containing protein [Deltaproteobacteria bacterium]|nr:DUF4337 domain-containing protein [Deltaproteobacteria bacterium]